MDVANRDTTQRSELEQSFRRVWGLVAATAILGVLLLALESGLDGRPVPSYISSQDFPIASYERLLGADRALCATSGDLLLSGSVECVAFDGHGGAGYALLATVVAASGALLVTQSRNRIGWLLMLVPLVDLSGAVSLAYVTQGAHVEPGSLPMPQLAAMAASVTWILLLVLVIPRLVMTFPNGRLPSDRWRWGLRFTYVAAGALLAVAMFHPMLAGSIPNPIALPWSVATADSVFGVAVVGMLASWGIAALALLVRVFTSLRARLTASPAMRTGRSRAR